MYPLLLGFLTGGPWTEQGYRVLVVEQTETPDQLELRRKEKGSKDKVCLRSLIISLILVKIVLFCYYIGLKLPHKEKWDHFYSIKWANFFLDELLFDLLLTPTCQSN